VKSQKPTKARIMPLAAIARNTIRPTRTSSTRSIVIGRRSRSDTPARWRTDTPGSRENAVDRAVKTARSAAARQMGAEKADGHFRSRAIRTTQATARIPNAKYAGEIRAVRKAKRTRKRRRNRRRVSAPPSPEALHRRA
jgi:hypothetical protein